MYVYSGDLIFGRTTFRMSLNKRRARLPSLKFCLGGSYVSLTLTTSSPQAIF